MFSGIIKAMGTVHSIQDAGTTKRIKISSSVSDSLSIDQSIAHDGVCLTVIEVEEGRHAVEVVHETLSKTSIGQWEAGRLVNLEKSITPMTLLDGHLVQGHVDTTLRCIRIDDMDGSWKIFFHLPDVFASYVIPQGSICINGVSLTIAELRNDHLAVSIIPYTLRHTNFHTLRVDDEVNVEFDLMGKYILRQMALRHIRE